MASIDLTQVRSVVASAYRVANTITNPSGMPAEVFVFRTNDQSFFTCCIAYRLKPVTIFLRKCSNDEQ
jgi:hypothetical protein